MEPIDSTVGPLLAQKDLTNSILRRHGFSVPEGAAVHRDVKVEAGAYFTALLATAPLGICVKPVNSGKGKKVFVGVRDLPSFESAFKVVAKRYDQILIEETVSGTVYQFFCVGGRIVAIRYGVPAHVMGDGIHSVAELARIKGLKLVKSLQVGAKFPRQQQRVLEEQGICTSSIPRSGEIIWLSRTSNLHQGADAIDATEALHSSYSALAEKAVQIFPGSILCGVDVAIDDPAVPATAKNHHFIELNDGPGFSGHHYPAEGKVRDVAGAIVDYLITRR